MLLDQRCRAMAYPIAFALLTLAAVNVAGASPRQTPGSAAPPVAHSGKDTLGYQDTPMVPGSKWHVHDGFRPQPPVIDPGPAPDKFAPPPADAVVLFDGTPESIAKYWRNEKGAATAWRVENGALISVKNSGFVYTRPTWGDCQLHVEFSTPTPAQGKGQGRGNSGVFLMGRYEIQVLDNYDNQTYPDGQCGAVYGQYPPLVNVCRKPGEWQTYDIFFTAPRFNADKRLIEPAYITILQNGVLVQAHTAILGDTGHKIEPKYNYTPPQGPFALQDHGNPVRYRNIWVRPLATTLAP